MINGKKLDILGTEYTIVVKKKSEDRLMRENNLCGTTGEYDKIITIADENDPDAFADWTEKEKETWRKVTLRHEIIHAFLFESGLGACSDRVDGPWALHEEMIDWFAVQMPKINKICDEVGAL